MLQRVKKSYLKWLIWVRIARDSRQLRKRLRAAELLKSSSLPPSMARRERVKSACAHLQDTPKKDADEDELADNSEYSPFIDTPATSDKARSAMTMLSSHGNNLAAILRCQASRYFVVRRNTGWPETVEAPLNISRIIRKLHVIFRLEKWFKHKRRNLGHPINKR